MRNTLRAQAAGSKFLYEPFDSAHHRVETLERVLDERWASLEKTLEGVERAAERLEKRLYYALFALSAGLLGQLAALLFTGALAP